MIETADMMGRWVREVASYRDAWLELPAVLTALAPNGSLSDQERDQACKAALQTSLGAYLGHLAWLANADLSEARAALLRAGVDPQDPPRREFYLDRVVSYGQGLGKVSPLAAAFKNGNVAVIEQALRVVGPRPLSIIKTDEHQSLVLAKEAGWLSHALEAGQWDCTQYLWDRLPRTQQTMDEALLFTVYGLGRGMHPPTQIQHGSGRRRDLAGAARWIESLLDAGADPFVPVEPVFTHESEWIAGRFGDRREELEQHGWKVVENGSYQRFSNWAIRKAEGYSLTAADLLLGDGPAPSRWPLWMISEIPPSFSSESESTQAKRLEAESGLIAAAASLAVAAQRVWERPHPLQRQARISWLRAVACYTEDTSYTSEILHVPSWLGKGWECFSIEELFKVSSDTPDSPVRTLAALVACSRPSVSQQADALLAQVLTTHFRSLEASHLVEVCSVLTQRSTQRSLSSLHCVQTLLSALDSGAPGRFATWEGQRQEILDQLHPSQEGGNITPASRHAHLTQQLELLEKTLPAAMAAAPAMRVRM